MKKIILEDLHHGVRVANMCFKLKKKFRISKRDEKVLYVAALFHDIGKAHLAQKILLKPGELNQSEYKHVKTHVFHSCSEIEKMGYNGDVVGIVMHHHENFDGSGYPFGKKAFEIPFLARFLKVVDVYDALTSNRPYRASLGTREAITVMRDNQFQYDPNILHVFASFALSREHVSVWEKKKIYL
ncbi:MAG: HD-GYP domain-containing protein [Alkaliphilus sp.]